MRVLRFVPLGLFVLATSSGVLAADAPPIPAGATAPPAKESRWVFSLLPKSFQRNPRLDFNILTEVTAEGKKTVLPTVASPAYYVAQSGGMHNTGLGAEYGLKGPPPEKLQAMIEKALGQANYLPADGAAHRPTLVIIYHWGSISFQPLADVSDGSGQGGVADSPIVAVKAMLDRATLLGGASFAQEVEQALQDLQQKQELADLSGPSAAAGLGSMGDMIPDPFDQLRMKSPEVSRLVDELFSSSYFVVASAYDYAAMARGQRRLLWRTKMTVNSLGVNMAESVPPLIASAAAYLGHETPHPVLVTRQISRDGRVEIGTPVVVPDKK